MSNNPSDLPDEPGGLDYLQHLVAEETALAEGRLRLARGDDQPSPVEPAAPATGEAATPASPPAGVDSAATLADLAAEQGLTLGVTQGSPPPPRRMGPPPESGN